MTKRWCINFVLAFIVLCVLGGGVTIVIDPYFHFHGPLPVFEYKIYSERYQNDGIVKHFDYNALITGTSMTENFKTTEMDLLFGVKSVKVPFAGAGYKEISENIERALEVNPELKMIVWGLDYNAFYGDADYTKYDSYPTYLYDNNPFNDVNYIFNKYILYEDTYKNVIVYTDLGGHTTTFDEYSNWNADKTFGKEAILTQFSRPAKGDDAQYGKMNTQNIEKNILSLVKDHPDTEFYLFWTPYSIIYFDLINQSGTLKNILTWEKEAIEMMLPYENLHLFSLFNDFDVITDLDNYKDILHYSEDINSYILESMANGEHEITMNNYEQYCQKEWEFYTMYDYDLIYKCD